MILNEMIEITSIAWKPQRNDEVDGIASGQIIVAELTTPLWTADIVSPLTTFEDGRVIRAMFNLFTKPNKVFEIYDPLGGYPQADPNGTILAAATVTVNSIVSGKISLGGLPAGYELTPGDYFTVEWGTDPVRRGFFEVSEAVTAGVGGVTPTFETFPNLLPGVQVGAAVNLKLPKMKAKIVPGTLQHPIADSSTWKLNGFQLTAIQKL